jgi:hypothetical protein
MTATTIPATSVAELLREAGPTVGLALGNKALGISRAHGYALARQDRYPVRLLKLGAAYRVVTSELLSLLCLNAA